MTPGRWSSSVSGFPPGFWWLWTSTLVNRLGTFVYPFLTLYLTVDRGYSAADAGLVLSLYGCGGVVGSLMGGDLTDRVGRRATMAGAQLATALATGAMGFVTQPAAIAGMAFTVGATASVSRPAVAAMTADLIAPEDRTRAFAVNYWAINIGFGLSAAVAGFIAREGYVWLFVGDAVTTLLCGAVMWFKLPETRPQVSQDPPSGGRPAPRTGLREVLRDRRFMSLTFLALGIWSIFYQCSSTLPVVMHDNGLSTESYGLVVGLNGLLVVLLQIPLTRLMEGRSQAAQLTSSAVLVGGGFGLTAFAGGSASLYATTVVVWTVGEMLYAPAASAAVAELAPRHAQGRYQGVFAFASSGAVFLAPLVGGFTLDTLGAPALWGGCAALGAGAAAGFWMLLRQGHPAPHLVVGTASPPSTGPALELTNTER